MGVPSSCDCNYPRQLRDRTSGTFKPIISVSSVEVKMLILVKKDSP